MLHSAQGLLDKMKGRFKKVLIGLGVVVAAASFLYFPDNPGPSDCPQGKIDIVLGQERACLTLAEFNEIRNSLAAKCATDEPFANIEEFQIFISVLNKQIKMDGGLTVKDVKGKVLPRICANLIR